MRLLAFLATQNATLRTARAYLGNLRGDIRDYRQQRAHFLQARNYLAARRIANFYMAYRNNQPQQQMNAIIQQLGNLATAIQAQANAPATQREANLVKIEPFYGDEQDPIAWIEEFEKASAANGYTDARKLQIVQAHLKGTATTWFYEQQSNPATATQMWTTNIAGQIPNSFKQPFIDHFRTDTKVAGWQQELTGLQQAAHQTVDQYATKVKELTRRIYPHGNLPIFAQISQFTNGLQQHLKFHVQTGNAQTLDEAIAIARRYETGYRQTGPIPNLQMVYQPAIHQPAANNDLLKTLNEIQTQMKALQLQAQQPPPRYNDARRNDYRNDSRPRPSFREDRYRENRYDNRRRDERHDNRSQWNPPPRQQWSAPPPHREPRPEARHYSCYSCGKPGHISTNCPDLGKQNPPPTERQVHFAQNTWDHQQMDNPPDHTEQTYLMGQKTERPIEKAVDTYSIIQDLKNTQANITFGQLIQIAPAV